MQAEPLIGARTDRPTIDRSEPERAAGEFPAALDEHQRMIEEVAEELALLRNRLAPITQDVETIGTATMVGGSDPSPPVSELTRRVRWMTEQLTVTRDGLRGARAYLDL